MVVTVLKPAYIDAQSPGQPTAGQNKDFDDVKRRGRRGRFRDLRPPPGAPQTEDEIEAYIDDVERLERIREQRERDRLRPDREERINFVEESPGYFNSYDFEDPYQPDWMAEEDLPYEPSAEWDRALTQDEIRFNPDDWEVYSENRFQKGWDADSTPKHEHFIDYERGNVKLRVYGKANIIASYGAAFYLSDADKDDSNADANARKVKENFFLDMGHTLHIRGIIGRKVTVKADIEAGRAVDDWEIRYTGDQREFIDYIRVGNFPLKFGETEFLVWEKSTRRTVGAEAKASRGKLSFHVVATLTKGEQGTSVFRGQTQEAREVIREFRYVRRKFYQLEPYCAYDYLCANTKPTITSASFDPNLSNSTSTNLITLTSHPTTFNSWRKNPDVQIIPGSLEVYINENRPGEPVQRLENFPNDTFRRMRQEEFAFPNNSGIIVFTSPIRYDRLVVVRYRRSSANDVATSDPAAYVTNSPEGTKIQVTIKGRTGLTEDTDNDGDSDVVKVADGVINRDVYEVKGYYSLNGDGATGEIKQDNFNLTFRNNNNEILPVSPNDPFSIFRINFENGVVQFDLREPFRALTNSQGDFIFEFNSAANRVADKIYDENLNPETADFTRVALNATFFRQVRAYTLQPNIIPGSVRVLIDGKEIQSSKYFVDNFAGTLVFLDDTDPYIGPETTITAHYEYSPFGATGEQGYVAGVRSEYQASRDIVIGNTVMFNGQFTGAEAPLVGEAPTSKVVLEGDVGVNFNEERVTRLANKMPFTDFDLLPMRVQGYAEYARTYFNPNTFGVALVDDMEASEDETQLPVSAAFWQLASPPDGRSQNDRGRLYYRYYYDPDNPSRGLLPLGSDVERRSLHSAPYSGTRNKGAVPGPYNVAEGHLDISQVNIDEGQRQESLVLEFDFSKNNGPSTGNERYVSIGTPVSQIGQNFSTISYIEFNARLIEPIRSNAPSPTSGVRLHFDVGQINEDADGDAEFAPLSSSYPGLDTEDQGYLDGLENENSENIVTELNGALDKERDNIRKREDRGFLFNLPDGSFTRVGAGPGVTNLFTSGNSLSDQFPSTIGNGSLNSEDWNFDNFLDTNEQIFTFDDNSIGAGKLTPTLTSNFLLRQGRWQQYRFYINRQNLTETEKAALERVFAVRLWITPAAGNNNQSGRILIDGIRFAGSKWRQTQGRNDLTSTDSFDLDNPEVVRVTNIDTFNSRDEYLSDSFLLEETEAYEEIHGDKTSTELRQIQETALKVEYDGTSLPSIREITASRQFVNRMDLSYYKKVALWVNFRQGTGRNDKLILRVGSSDQDYLEYSQTIDIGGWQKLIYELNSSGADARVGDPNLRNVTRFELGVRNDNIPPRGEFWVNDIIVQDPVILQDDAYVYRTTVQFTKPAFKTAAGIPILGDFKIDYEDRKVGANFSTIGQQATGIEEFRRQLNISTQVYGQYWTTEYGFLMEKTNADPRLVDLLASENGDTFLREHSTLNNLAYVDYEWLPTFILGYKNRVFRADREEKIDEPITNSVLTSSIHEEEEANSPTIQIKEVFPEFFDTNITANYSLAVRFFEKSTETKTEGNIVVPAEDDVLIVKEQGEEQMGNLEIRYGRISLAPTLEWANERLLAQSEGDQIVRRPPNAAFYAPVFSAPKDFRYRTRGHKAGVKFVWEEFLWILNPSIEGSGQYLENNFIDNLYLPEDTTRFGRLKGATTTVNHTLSIPTNVFTEKPFLGFLQSFTPTYSRETTLVEQDLPFTAKSGVFQEEYGLQRTAPPLMDSVFNLGRFPYWHYYQSGRGRKTTSFSNARDFVHRQKMDIIAPNGLEDRFLGYENSLTFRDSAAFTLVFSFWDPLVFTTNATQEQITTRPTIGSLPTHEGRLSFTLDQTYNLMKIFNFWFWRANQPGKTIHRSQLNFRFGYTQQQLITQNLDRNTFTYEPSLTFSWGYSSLIFSFGFDVHTLREFDYIAETGNRLDARIYDTIPDVPPTGLDEEEYSYRPGIKYITQIPSLRIWFARTFGMRLIANPRYTIAAEVDINRYEYDIVQRLPLEARDLYSLRQSLDLNLHANLTGALDFLLVYDVARNPVSNVAKTEIFGFEIGMGLKILF